MENNKHETTKSLGKKIELISIDKKVKVEKGNSYSLRNQEEKDLLMHLKGTPRFAKRKLPSTPDCSAVATHKAKIVWSKLCNDINIFTLKHN